MSESVAQWGTEGRFAVLSSELEEACPSFEATTVPASSNAVRSAHRICTDRESSTEVVEPIPVQNNGGDVNHRHQRRRLVVYQPQTEPTVPDVPDSHDERLQRVREDIWQESHNMPGGVRRVRDMVMCLVDRVGHVDHSAGVIPREIRRQQWSFLNIPLMWAAATGDRSNVVLQWLAASARNTSVPVCGASLPGNEAVMIGWDSLHGAMQVLGIRSREGLAEWVHTQGFHRPRWGAHFSGRAQERACAGHWIGMCK